MIYLVFGTALLIALRGFQLSDFWEMELSIFSASILLFIVAYGL